MSDRKKYMNLSGAEALLEFQEDQEEVEAALLEEQRRHAESQGREFTPLGRPYFDPTDEQRKLVKELCTAGIPIPIVAQAIRREDGRPLSTAALLQHFPDEMRDGHVQATTAVAGSLFKLAMSGNVAAQCFWLKTRGFGAYREVVRSEVTGKDGAPLSTVSGVLMVPAPMSEADWERIVSEEQASLVRKSAAG